MTLNKNYREPRFASKSFWVPLSSAILGALLACAIFSLIVYFKTDFALLDADFCGKRFDWVLCYASAEWNEESYLATITSFYETIIVVLLSLLTALAFFSFVIIRSDTKEWVLEGVNTQFEVFTRTADFQTRLEEQVRGDLEDLEARIERLEE